ncbi:MAG: MotA/TolQ/ExbB proton channel family protein, partial [Bacteroidales bacterium]|nr:MotA/TolQ/ExbB proton channel family protein [Bacteroidales bacterium]
MFLAVAGLLTFTANIASAQEEGAAPAATEQVEEAEEVVDLFAGSGEEVPLHQALKTKFIEGGAGFMRLVLICLILGLALAIERILYLAFSKSNTTKRLDKVEAALKEG